MKRSKEHLPNFALFCCSYCHFLYQNRFLNRFFGLTPDNALIHNCMELLFLARWRKKLFRGLVSHTGALVWFEGHCSGALLPCSENRLLSGAQLGEQGCQPASEYAGLSQNHKRWESVFHWSRTI